MDDIPAFAAAQAGQAHPNFAQLTLQVFEAVVEVVCIALPGYVVARSGNFGAAAQKAIANLNMTLFTPCLIFTKLASQLTGDRLPELVVIPFILAVQTAVSFVSAKASIRIFKVSKKPQANFITAMAVFGNSNSLPLSLVVSLSHTIPGLHWDKIPGDNDDEVAARGILYLLVFAQLGQALRWSWGEKQLLKPLDRYTWAERHGIADAGESEGSLLDRDDDPNKHRANGTASELQGQPSGRIGPHPHTDGAADEQAQAESDSAIGQYIANARTTMSAKMQQAHNKLPKPVKLGLHYVNVVVRSVIGILNPPLTAILVSLIVALIPPLQAFFFTDRTFVNNSVTYAIEQLGNLAVPITLVVLGSNLARNTIPEEDSSDVGTVAEQRKMLWLSLLCRMVLPVLVQAPLLMLGAKYWNASILDDPIFVIVCFLLAGAPSALQLSQICQVNGVLVTSAATLLFHSYVIWVMPSTLILVLMALEVVQWAA